MGRVLIKVGLSPTWDGKDSNSRRLLTIDFRCPIPTECHFSACLDRGEYRDNHGATQQYHLDPFTGYSLQHGPPLQYTDRARPEQRNVQQLELEDYFNFHRHSLLAADSVRRLNKAINFDQWHHQSTDQFNHTLVHKYSLFPRSYVRGLNKALSSDQ